MWSEEISDTNSIPLTFEGCKIAHSYAPHKPLFRLENEIGHGAFGAVYRALDLPAFNRSPKQPVYRAVKVMKNFGIRLHERDALAAEERLHAKVQEHPNILSVFDVVEFGNYKFFIYEMMDTDLFDVISGGKVFYLNDQAVRRVILGVSVIPCCHFISELILL